VSENVVAIKKLLEVSAHYGHLARLLNPKARRFVYGQRNGISIIDLQKTVKYFREASQYVSQLCADGGHILFVGTKRQSRDLVKEHALRSQQYYMNHRWLGGTLTNHPTIRKSIHKLKKIEKMSQDGTYEKMTKKEALNLERLRQKLDINLGGIKDMPGLPKALFITDALKERTALLEANLLNIPVIAIIDTNVNPDGVDYPIPGNDDSLKSLELFISAVGDAALKGVSQQKTSAPKDGARRGNRDRHRSSHGRSKSSQSSFQGKHGRTVKVERAEKRPSSSADSRSHQKQETTTKPASHQQPVEKPTTAAGPVNTGDARTTQQVTKKPSSDASSAPSSQPSSPQKLVVENKADTVASKEHDKA